MSPVAINKFPETFYTKIFIHIILVLNNYYHIPKFSFLEVKCLEIYL